MNRRGFTIVEIIITITIMGILLTLAVVNLSSTQLSARDSERTSDVESLSLALEGYYNNEQDGAIMSGRSYPGTAYLTPSIFAQILPDIDPKLVYAPGADQNGAMSFIKATNATQTIAGVAPQPTTSTYVYQPITKEGTLCVDPAATGECRKFNIFYRLEADNSVKMVTSKNQ